MDYATLHPPYLDWLSFPRKRESRTFSINRISLFDWKIPRNYYLLDTGFRRYGEMYWNVIARLGVDSRDVAIYINRLAVILHPDSFWVKDLYA